MDLSTKEKKKLAGLINAFGNSSFKNGQIEVDYEQQPYYNLISALYEIKEIRELYDEDLVIHGITTEILSLFKVLPIIVGEEDIESIISGTVNTLKNNILDHLIVIPIQYAQFKEKIKFDNLTFIPQDYSKESKIRIIARIAGKTLKETISITGHTEKSRSPDFLKYPLLCIKQRQQTSSVHYNALNIAKVIIYSLRCFYFGLVKGTKFDTTSISVSMETQNQVDASHLAIYSKENWRQNHKPLDFDVSVPFALNWLNDKKFQKKLRIFLREIYFKTEIDDFDIAFLNALYLFNESIKQNTSLSTLLIMTIAESLLTREKNEKRLRISAIVPRLLGLKKSEMRNTGKVLSEEYQKRNNFVHSGQEITIQHNYETHEVTSFEKSRKIIAEVIIQYPNFEKIIEKKIPTTELRTSKSLRFGYWNKYIDDIFSNAIYGR